MIRCLNPGMSFSFYSLSFICFLYTDSLSLGLIILRNHMLLSVCCIVVWRWIGKDGWFQIILFFPTWCLIKYLCGCVGVGGGDTSNLRIYVSLYVDYHSVNHFISFLILFSWMRIRVLSSVYLSTRYSPTYPILQCIFVLIILLCIHLFLSHKCLILDMYLETTFYFVLFFTYLFY